MLQAATYLLQQVEQHIDKERARMNSKMISLEDCLSCQVASGYGFSCSGLVYGDELWM